MTRSRKTAWRFYSKGSRGGKGWFFCSAHSPSFGLMFRVKVVLPYTTTQVARDPGPSSRRAPVDGIERI